MTLIHQQMQDYYEYESRYCDDSEIYAIDNEFELLLNTKAFVQRNKYSEWHKTMTFNYKDFYNNVEELKIWWRLDGEKLIWDWEEGCFPSLVWSKEVGIKSYIDLLVQKDFENTVKFWTNER